MFLGKKHFSNLTAFSLVYEEVAVPEVNASSE